MANYIYNKAKQKFLEARISWETDFIRCVLVDTSAYTFNAGHEFLSSIPPNARIAVSPRFVNVSTEDGIAKADPVILPNVTGNNVEAIVVYKESFNPLTAPLIVYIDDWQQAATPIELNGITVTISWSTLYGVFKL